MEVYEAHITWAINQLLVESYFDFKKINIKI